MLEEYCLNGVKTDHGHFRVTLTSNPSLPAEAKKVMPEAD